MMFAVMDPHFRWVMVLKPYHSSIAERRMLCLADNNSLLPLVDHQTGIFAALQRRCVHTAI